MRGKFVVSRELTDINLKTVSDPRSETINEEHGKDFYYLVEKTIEEVRDYVDVGPGRDDALIITDGKGKIAHFNETWGDLCGFSLDEAVGKTGKILQGPLTDKKAVMDMNERLHTGLFAQTSLVNYRRSGVAFINNLTIVPMYDWLQKERSLPGEKREGPPLGMAPTHFIAKIEHSENRYDLPPLTKEEMEARGLATKHDSKEDQKEVL